MLFPGNYDEEEASVLTAALHSQPRERVSVTPLHVAVWGCEWEIRGCHGGPGGESPSRGGATGRPCHIKVQMLIPDYSVY